MIATATNLTAASSNNIRVDPPGVVPTILDFQIQPATVGKNQTMTTFTVQVEDGTSLLVGTDNATQCSLSVLSGSGVVSGTTTKTAVAGTCTFDDIKISEVGTHILRASSTGLTAGDSSSFIVNTTGTASRLTFTQQPVIEVAGTTFGQQAIVAVQDETGTTVTDENGSTVTLTCSNPVTCTLDGAPLTITVLNGVATFVGSSVRISNAIGNNIALTATSSSSFTATTTPLPVVINPATFDNAQSSINVTANPSAINTNDGAVDIFILDQFGNPRVGDTVTTVFSPAGCTETCGTTDATGKATCNFTCVAPGGHTIRIENINGGASGFTKTSAFNVP